MKIPKTKKQVETDKRKIKFTYTLTGEFVEDLETFVKFIDYDFKENIQNIKEDDVLALLESYAESWAGSPDTTIPYVLAAECFFEPNFDDADMSFEIIEP